MPFNKCSSWLLLLCASMAAQTQPPIWTNRTYLPAGSGDTVIQVTGENFTADSQVLLNGQPQPTQFINDLLLKFTASQQDLFSPGLSNISVSLGGQVSTSRPFVTYLPIANKDVIYDRSRSLLYAAVVKTDPNGPSLALIDPTAGVVQRYIPFPSEPTTLALSDDNRYLYVGLQDRVRRIDLAGNSVFDIPFVAISPALTSNVASGIVVLPGQPTSFIVVMIQPTTSTTDGIAYAVDGSTRRTNSVGGVQCLAGTADGKSIFGIDYSGFQTYTLDANGLALAGTGIPGLTDGSGPAFGACPAYANGVIYGANGDIVDPSTSTRIGAFPAAGLVHATSDGQIWFLSITASPPNYSTTFVAFDSASGEQLQTLSLPMPFIAANGRLVDLGASGMAFGDYSTYSAPNQAVAKWLYIIRTPQ